MKHGPTFLLTALLLAPLAASYADAAPTLTAESPNRELSPAVAARLRYGKLQPAKGAPIALPERDPKTAWFETAKLGIFLHWGIWAVDGTVESHPFNQPPSSIRENPDAMTREQYFSQLSRFRAENYNPEAWAEVFQKAGARYAILTTKHHDGVALWDTRAPGGVDVVDGGGGAARDLVKPWVTAMRKADIRVGFYYSLADWGNPDYPVMLPPPGAKSSHRNKPYSYSATKDDPERWAQFIAYRDAQIEELLPYKPDVWWMDGGWERTREQWNFDAMVARLLEANPDVIFGRMGYAIENAPKYTTPERAIPLRTPTGLWELCQTFNEHWSYRSSDTQTKDPALLVKIFSEVIARSGNLLLNIGPKPDGTLPEDQVAGLLDLGAWINRNKEAIYPTFGGERLGFSFLRFFGPTTVAPDGKTLYLFVDGRPNGCLVLRGIVSKIRKAEVLATGEELDFRRLCGNSELPGDYIIHAPKAADPLMTVVKLSFDEVIELGK
ncbi:MAG: alpha-L-fucosidase [Verrucomicrobiae bacterium]|nr:alpha-L-fucosidase [Verrucomicrobiae bacterium]